MLSLTVNEYNEQANYGVVCMVYVYVESKPFIITLSYHFFAHWIVSREGHTIVFCWWWGCSCNRTWSVDGLSMLYSDTIFFVVVIIKSIIKARIKRIRWGFIQQQSEWNILCHNITIILWVCVWYYYCGEKSSLTWHADQPTPTNMTSGRTLSQVLIKMKLEKSKKWEDAVIINEFSCLFIELLLLFVHMMIIRRWWERGGYVLVYYESRIVAIFKTGSNCITMFSVEEFHVNAKYPFN